MLKRTLGFRPACKCPGLDGDSPGSDCADEDNWPSVPGVVLDPFSGAGTVALVAAELGRRRVGVDASATYSRMAEERVSVAQRQTRLALDETAVMTEEEL